MTQLLFIKIKKATEPMAVLGDELVVNVLDELSKDEATVKVNRNMRLLSIAEDGSEVRIWFSPAKDIEKKTFCGIPRR